MELNTSTLMLVVGPGVENPVNEDTVSENVPVVVPKWSTLTTKPVSAEVAVMRTVSSVPVS